MNFITIFNNALNTIFILHDLHIHSINNINGNVCSHFDFFPDCVSNINKINIIIYTDSSDISMVLSILLLNGLTSHRYIKQKNCKMNSNMTASGPSCCPQIITNAVNMYFLIILTDRYDLEMFGPKYGQNLWNINIYANLLIFL